MKIPFPEIGIDQTVGTQTIEAIKTFVNERPGRSIELRTIAEVTGLPGDIVKEVFWALLSLRYLKPTFMPRHKKCDAAVGLQENSVTAIENKLEEGGIPAFVCVAMKKYPTLMI